MILAGLGAIGPAAAPPPSARQLTPPAIGPAAAPAADTVQHSDLGQALPVMLALAALAALTGAALSWRH